MVEKQIVIKNEDGLHARPIATLAQKLQSYEGKVEFIKGDQVANAKSVFGVMSMGISKGTEITVRVEGDGEEAELEKIIDFIENLEE